MDFFLVASTPFLRFSTHTCALSLLKTSLFCFFLFFQDGGVSSQGSMRCGLQSRGTPCPPPHPKSGLLSFVNFSSCRHPFKTGRRGKARGAPYCKSLLISCLRDCWGTDLQSSVRVYSHLARFGQEQEPMCFC